MPSSAPTADSQGHVHQNLGRVEGKIDMILSNVNTTREDLRELSARLRHLEETSVRHEMLQGVEARVSSLEKIWAKVLGVTLGVTMLMSLAMNSASKYITQLFHTGV